MINQTLPPVDYPSAHVRTKGFLQNREEKEDMTLYFDTMEEAEEPIREFISTRIEVN